MFSFLGAETIASVLWVPLPAPPPAGPFPEERAGAVEMSVAKFTSLVSFHLHENLCIGGRGG